MPANTSVDSSKALPRVFITSAEATTGATVWPSRFGHLTLMGAPRTDPDFHFQPNVVTNSRPNGDQGDTEIPLDPHSLWGTNRSREPVLDYSTRVERSTW